MATAKPMAQQQNNKKHGSLMQDACFTDGMVDHDMHLKMSKKIAQLTKVIYALNTKNDEHEHIVKSLQQQHDKEKYQLLQGTKTKIEELRNKLGVEVELTERIASLESCIEEHEKQKKRLLHDFDTFKGECADNEAVLRSESNKKITQLSEELLHYQNEFEQKASTFETLMNAFEREKEQSLNDLRSAHQIEVAHLVKAQQSEASTRELELTNELAMLKTTYAAKIEQADIAFHELKASKDEMEEDYVEKLKKSKSLYEKELELLQQKTSQVDNDTQKKLRETIDKLTKDYQYQEAQHRKRIDNLLSDLSLSEDAVNELKKEISLLSSQNTNLTGERDSLSNQMESMKADTTELLEKHREMEREMQVIRQRCSDQSDQLVKKSGLIGELNAAKMEKESQLQKLTDELSDVSRKLKILQDEKNMLLSKSSTDAEQKSLEVQSLEKALQDLRIEKKAQCDKYQADITTLEQLLEEEKVHSSNKLEEKVSELELRHSQEMQSLSEQEKQKMAKLEQELKNQLVEETARLEDINKELRATLKGETAELQKKLEASEAELERLQRLVGDSSENLGAANNELVDLRAEVSNLKQQLDTANSELRSVSSHLTTTQDEVKNLHKTNNTLIKDHEEQLKSELEKQNKSLEASWLEKLRKETSALKSELERQFANDRASAIKHLSEQKDEQIQRIILESESKLQQLMMQITNLERRLDEEETAGGSKIDSLKETYEQQIKVLTLELDKLTREYEEKLSNLSLSLKTEWEQKLRSQSDELEAAVVELKNKHIEDMRSQMTAHKATADMLRREADSILQSEVDKLRSMNSEEKNSLIAEMESKHKMQLEIQSQNSIKQVAALKMELQRSVELTKRKENELQAAQEEYSEKLGLGNRNIRSLELDIQKLQEQTLRLNGEIEAKRKEIQRAQSEASRQLREREEFLAQERCEELERMQAYHADETQQMLSEFTKAQAILKEKIQDLSTLLEEAEERYLNREPREEDLNMIEQMRRMLTQREQEMQQLLADKQYYQMELVNRETNFTKVFAGSKGGPQQPQVGFINPLAKKKKGEKGPTKYAVNMSTLDGGVSGNSGNSSASSTTQRLRPIAGSPIHDERLNPNNVLPTPSTFTKKFVQ